MEKEKILVCWDGSEQARKALNYAIDDAKEKGIKKIDAVYVIEEIPTSLGLGFEDDESLFDYDIFEAVKTKGKKLLEEAKSVDAEKDVKVETHLIEYGVNPSVEIAKFGEENGFDHIYVGSHGRSGISRILLGSVAEGIIRKAHCVVTVVRGEHC